MSKDKKYILAIVISVIFAGLVGFYAGRYYEVHTARKRFAQMRSGNFQQGQRGVRLNGRGNQFDPLQAPTSSPTN